MTDTAMTRRALLAAGAGVVAGSVVGTPAARATVQPQGTIGITKGITHQRINGFGASANNPVDQLRNDVAATDRQAVLDFLFGAGGLRLSMVRLEVNPFHRTDPVPVNALQATFQPAAGTWDWDTDHHQRWLAAEAMNRGVTRFVAVPWSPPGWMKTNGSVTGGGALKPANRPDLVNHLREYAIHYANLNGINAGWISVQNEPDLPNPGYAGCGYTGAEMAATVNAVKQGFTSAGVWSRVLAPECMGPSATASYLAAMNAATLANLDAVASHGYTAGTWASLAGYGKQVWQTEHSNLHADDPGMGDGIRWAKDVITALGGGVSVYLYWWLVGPAGGTTGEALVNLVAGSPVTYRIPKRSYCFGQFSRFIRPGYVRIAATSSTANLTQIAVKDPATGKAVVVVVNGTTTTTPATVTGLTAASVALYRTSATENLAALGNVAVSGGAASVSFAPQSVTTLVENVTDTAAPAAVGNLAAASTARGVRLTWTNPGSTGTTGTADRTTIRMSTAPITAANFASATLVPGAPAPQVAGIGQSHLVTGVAPNTTYYFALTNTDDTGNTSAVSNVASVGVGARAYPIAARYEAEHLAVTTSPGVTTDVIADAAASGGQWVTVATTAAGQQVTFTASATYTGTARLKVGIKKYPSRGIVQAAVNGTSIGSPIDGYAAGPEFVEHDLGPITLTRNGSTPIRFTVTGKNAASTGYSIGIDYVVVAPS